MGPEPDQPVIGVIDDGTRNGLQMASAGARQRWFSIRSVERDAPVAEAIAGLIVDVPLDRRAELVANLRQSWQVPILIESPVAADLDHAGSAALLADDSSIVSANPLRFGLHTRRLLEDVRREERPLETFFAAWRFRAGPDTNHALSQLLDFIAALCPGEIRRVSALGRHHPTILLVTLRYVSGAIGSLEVGTHLPPSFPAPSELVIECACSERMYHCTPGDQSITVHGGTHTLHNWQPDPADAIVAAFAGWLRGGPRPYGSIRADLTALALREQILHAARASSALTTTKG